MNIVLKKINKGDTIKMLFQVPGAKTRERDNIITCFAEQECEVLFDNHGTISILFDDEGCLTRLLENENNKNLQDIYCGIRLVLTEKIRKKNEYRQ